MLYALVIKEEDLEFITILNKGITPVINKEKETFILFKVDNGVYDTKIVTKDELRSNYYWGGGPILIRVEEAFKTEAS